MPLKQKSVLRQVTRIFVLGYALRSYTVYEGEGPNRFSRRTCFGNELSRWINQAVINRSERILSRGTINRKMSERLMDDHVKAQKCSSAPKLEEENRDAPGL